MCWLRQRYTYPATVVAPLSKGDAGAVPFVSIFSILRKMGRCRGAACSFMLLR